MMGGNNKFTFKEEILVWRGSEPLKPTDYEIYRNKKNWKKFTW